ncbi:MAG: hypothetical protein C4617_03045 [Candidatus Liberibacter europaeus]|uniref:Uncharacterized protein n=1 Tax=Candidatus Liberibacter europaeus TaxID=744859 RepID=A0A2T4VYD3_9HYPH|nr:hypothetical protein [Candidatus Liberibacter europaeus]PTL86789.1 MAG: hypothetical protein C4617_03045 [Candidatus Liberibacter europaeus]
MNVKATNFLFVHNDNFYIAKADEDGNMGKRINIAPDKVVLNDYTIQVHITKALQFRMGIED